MENNSVNVEICSSDVILEVSTPCKKQTITATNNRAEYYTEMAKKYMEEAKKYKDETKDIKEETKDILEQNTDVTTGYVDKMKEYLEKEIAKKQPLGEYAKVVDIPQKVSDLADYENYVIETELESAINEVRLPSQELQDGNFLMTDGEKPVWSEVSDFNSYNTLTNCILEIPQRIKMELADGILTLKSGSVITVPNGKNTDGSLKFDHLTITSDRTNAQTGNGTYFVFALNNGTGIFVRSIDRVESGATRTLSSTYSIWYDTVNNLVYNYTTDATTSGSKGALPLALITVSNGAISSIDQVFNGFGYIGSTIFVDKGVKGLIPNGRNEDGTLNNIEFTTSKVMIEANLNFTETRSIRLRANDIAMGGLDYDFIKNQNLANGEYRDYAIVGEVTISSSAITDLKVKQPFRAVDFSDFLSPSEISGLGLPSSKYIDLTLGASPSSYKAPANGWVVFRRTATEAGQNTQIANHTRQGIQMWSHAVMAGNVAGGYIPVQKDDIFVVGYTLGSENNQIFRFVYAEGEV